MESKKHFKKSLLDEFPGLVPHTEAIVVDTDQVVEVEIPSISLSGLINQLAKQEQKDREEEEKKA